MKFGIIANTRKQKVIEILPDFFCQLKKRGINAVVTPEIKEFITTDNINLESYSSAEIGRHCDIAISFGGDGTILSAAKILSPFGVPILGVNVGRFGFLTEILVKEIAEKLDDLVTGNFEIENRIALTTSITNDDDSKRNGHFAVNDVVLQKSGFAKTLMIETYVGDEYLNTYNADGIIIASPTGSTAYSLSAGGPLVAPGMEAMVITPICPHSLSQRPLVIKDDLVIKILASSEKGDMLLFVDGEERFKVEQGQAVYVQKSQWPVRLIKCSGNSFYKVLRTKLSWGELPIKNQSNK